MVDRKIPDLGGQEPPPDPNFWNWLKKHPGAQPPTDSPLGTFRAVSPLGLGQIKGLPGDWSQYTLVSWGRFVKPETARRPEWGTIKWTAVFATEGPNGPYQREAIYHRIHVLYRDSFAWIEATRTPPADFTIVPRGFDRCRSEDEGHHVLRGWKFILFNADRGHPPEPDVSFEEYMKAWRQVRPLYKKRGLLTALAAKLGRHTNTIRNYHGKYGWPLYEDPNKLDISWIQRLGEHEMLER